MVAATLAVSGARGPSVELQGTHPEAAVLEDAGWRHGTARWEALRLAVVAAGLLLAIAVGAPVAIALLAAVLPSLWAHSRAERARERSRRAQARILASIGSALRSGLPLPDALRRANEGANDEVATRSLGAALRAFELGGGLDEALRAAAARTPDQRERVALGTLALGIGERLPRERLADLVDAVADRTAFDLRLEEEVRARAAGARQQQKLLALIVPALALYLCITVPSLAATLGSDLGRYVLIPGAVALELGGILLGRRIVRGTTR